MKTILTDLTHSIMPKVLSFGNKHYLVISTCLYFDIPSKKFLNLNMLMNDASTFTRENQNYDEFCPKNNGEILVFGNCHSPEPTTSMDVGFMIKGDNFELSKKLTVVGDRVLHKNILGVTSISKPQEFSKLKIGYENSYGGLNFNLNPIGKGFQKKLGLNESIQMHNIDLKNHPVLNHKKENAVSYSFDSIDLNWKSRIEKIGTYDGYWQKNHWPYYPEDIDTDIFNIAPIEQRISGYFKGNESYEIFNMNEKNNTIEGTLPGKIVKTFVTKLSNDEEEFLEIKTVIDTIVFFPEVQRVAVINRAFLEVKDDEFNEITSLFTISENINEEKHSLSYYRNLMEKSIDNPLSIDDNTMKNNDNKMLLNPQDLGFYFELSLRRHLEELPHIVPSSKGIKATQDDYKNLIDTYLLKNDLTDQQRNSFERLKLLTKHDAFTQNINKNYEHVLEQHKDDIEEKINTYQSKYSNVNIREKFENEVHNIKNAPELNKIRKNGYESLLIQNWSDGARFFLGDKNNSIKNDNERYTELVEFGLNNVTINHFLYVGYNNEKVCISKKQWIDNENEIIIEKGFVLAYFDANKIRKMVTRENIFNNNSEFLGDKYDKIIDGSEEMELILKGSSEQYLIVVDDILEAYLLFQDFWKVCSIIVVKNKEDFLNCDYYTENKANLEYIITTKFDLKLDNIKTLNLNIQKNIYKEYKLKRDLKSEILNALPETKIVLLIKKDQKNKIKMGSKYIGLLDFKKQEKRIKQTIFKKFKVLEENEELLSMLNKKEKKTISRSNK